ncbi:hypothetical protein CTAYLR_009701 [Chrysophaeum taylorii]|uniref:Uncharacterized protein n=1 Tax=Chrysophaeum taylorii TaxID=2483200 RepID=A0AAD7XI95_9STRA|nr:hypothetical protein CTAYLR_009701 [Chrysophaeum taylorii]
MEISLGDESAWASVPSVLRRALTRLAQTSAATSQRVADLEQTLEEERLRFAETTARLVDRVEAAERGASGGIDRVWQQALADRCRELEARFQGELDAARADSAATRAVATLRGASDALVAASVAAAIDEAAPRIAAEAAATVARDHRPQQQEQPVASHARLATECAEALALAKDAAAATERLEADVRARPTRQECGVIAKDAVALRVAPLSSDLAELRRLRRVGSDDSDGHYNRNLIKGDDARSGGVDLDAIRRCEARCEEVASTIDAVERGCRQAIEDTEASLRRALRDEGSELAALTSRVTAIDASLSELRESDERIEENLKSADAELRDQTAELRDHAAAVRGDVDALKAVTETAALKEAMEHATAESTTRRPPPPSKAADDEEALREETAALEAAMARATLGEEKKSRSSSQPPPAAMKLVADAALQRVLPNDDRLTTTKNTPRAASRESEERVAALRRDVEAATSAVRKDLETFKKATETALKEKRSPGESPAAMKLVVDSSVKRAVDAAARDIRSHVDSATREMIESATREMRFQVTEAVSKGAEAAEATRLELEEYEGRFEPLRRRGRWLWRSGRVSFGGYIPWDLEALNSARDIIAWRKDLPSTVTINAAGLYRVAVGVFTHADATVQLCVGGEPVLTLEPQPPGTTLASQPPNGATIAHSLRRSAHSAGEIACICIDEPPPSWACDSITASFVVAAAVPVSAFVVVVVVAGLDARDASCQAFLSILKV